MKPIAKVEVVSDHIQDALIESDLKRTLALEMLGMQAEKYAKALCPVGTPESTGIKGYMGGTLRNSITHKVDAGQGVVYIGTNVEYAPYVELGTVKMEKKPYLKPAVEDHVAEYRSIIDHVLR